MASGRGYLGKISAVVAANTGDYVRKLNDSAARTKAFANEISGDLRRASADVNKSIASILTPLQRYERAIQNAAAQKLAFRGFDGAIQTVEQLRKAIARISDRPSEVEFVVRQTGLRNIEQVRQVIGDLKQSEVDLAVNVGGVAGLRALRDDVQEVDGKTINVKTRIDASRLDELIAKFSTLSADGIKNLQIAVETRQLEQAVAQSDRLKSVAFEITDAYGRAKAQFAGFSAEVQAALGPAVLNTDQQVEQLINTFREGGTVGEAEFRRIAAAARQTERAIADTAEIQSRISNLRTGREAAFAAPQLDDLLSRAQRAGEAAAALPVGRRASGEIGGLVSEISRIAQAAGVAEAAVAGIADPALFAAARAEADRLRAEFAAAVELLEGELPVNVTVDGAIRETNRLREVVQSLREEANFQITGEFQSIRQAESSVRQLLADLDKLGTQQTAALRPQIDNTLAAIELGDITLIREEYAKLKTQFDEELRIKVNNDEATAEFVRLRDEKRSLDATPGNPRGEFGPFPTSSALSGGRSPGVRAINEAGGAIDALRTRVDGLADPLRGEFGPEVDRITNKWRTLAREGVGFTAEEIARLRGETTALFSALDSRKSIGDRFLGSFGGAGSAGLSLGIDQKSLQSVGSQIEFVQNKLSGLGREARGPVVEALESLRVAANRLFSDGAIDTEEGRAELVRLREELVRVLSVATGDSAKKINSALERVGDVARGGFGNAQLAIQQAAFAVDDFFSVTGGLDQRIRAAANNVSQLGFILGSTEGLVIGIAASIGGQLVAAILRYTGVQQQANGRAEALTEILERQKSTVQELAEAFNQLGASLSQNLFSQRGGRASEFGRQVESLRDRQRSLREESLFATDPAVIEARAAENAAEKRRREAGTIAESVAAERDALDARRRRRIAEQQARARPGRSVTVAADEAIRAVQDDARRRAAQAAAATGAAGGSPQAAQAAFETQLARGRERVADFTRQRDQAAQGGLEPIELIRLLREQQQVLRREGGASSNQAVAELEAIIRSLEEPARRAIDELGVSVLEGARPIAVGIEQAQREIDAAFQAGIPGVSAFQARVDSISQGLERLDDELTSIAERLASGQIGLEQAQEETRSVGQRREELRARQQQAVVESDRLRRERTLNPGRQIEAVINRTQATIDRIGAPAGGLLSKLQELQFQRETVRQQLEAAPADPLLLRAEQELTQSIRSLEGEVNALDETLNGFEAREARRLTGDPERGRQLAMTPGERAAEQVQQGINDIRARFGEVAAETTGLVDQQGQQEAIARFISEQLRQFAPAVFSILDEVANSVLQGPSRAALTATDASTVEGQRELNRLLRGDDPARDVNLLELQKQTAVLEKIEAKIDPPNPVAN